jgi:hypothetical protein
MKSMFHPFQSMQNTGAIGGRMDETWIERDDMDSMFTS